MSTRKQHLDYIAATKGKFTLDCSREIFSNEEIEILKKYGHWFLALTTGHLAPITERQVWFILVAKFQRKPISLEEQAWHRYLGRKAYEAKYGDKYHVPTHHYEEDTFYSRDMAKKLKSTMFKVMWENHKKP